MMSSHSIIDSLDDLEIKFNAVQKRIIGCEGARPENNQTIEEILTQSNSAIDDAVFSHSHIKYLLKRREELDRYLDPTFWDSFLDTVTKTQIIYDSRNELKETIDQLRHLNDLIHFSNTEVFQTIPNSKAELSSLTQGVIDLQEQSNRLKSAVKCLMTKYFNVINYTNKVMFQLCSQISEIESFIGESYD